ncbi:unnamed protein product [Diamesa serratosioi]
MESTGSIFAPVKSWQWAILLGTPLAIGIGYMLYTRKSAIEDEVGDSEEKKKEKAELRKRLKNGKTISIDGDDKLEKPAPVAKQLTPFEQAVEFKTEGNNRFKVAKYDEAIELYSQAVNACPKEKSLDLSQFYQNRAAAYEQLKNWYAVRDDCTAALELTPKYIKALHRRARAYEKLKQLDLCLEDITATCILEGFQNTTSLILADRILKELGQQHAKQAMATKKPVDPSGNFVHNYFKSFSQDPVHTKTDKTMYTSHGNPTAYLKALQAFKEGRISEIVPSCSVEIESPDSEATFKMEATVLRATFYLLSGQYNEALIDLNNVINNPDADYKVRSNAYIKRASLNMQTEKKDLSFNDFDDAIKIDPNNPDIYHHRGQVYLLLEQIENAVEDFTKAQYLLPEDPLTYIHLLYSEYRKATADGDNATLFAKIEDFSKAVERFPDCTECYSLFAQVLSDQNQFQLADTYFEKALKLEANNASLYVHRGLLQLQWQGDIDASLKLLNKAIEIDDKCVLALETLGTVEVQRGNLNEAIRLFEKALLLAKSEMELTHIYSLKDAAQAQMNVTKRLGLDMESIMNGLQHLQ